MLLLLALLPLTFAAPAPQSFDNFPQVGETADLLTNADTVDFIEEAVEYTPADRSPRQVSLPALEDAIFSEIEAVEAEVEREERDGAHAGAHGQHREGRRQQQRQAAPVVQEARGGRQTGGVAPALGVLNNTPNQDGEYNFNFATNDGIERQEVGRPGFIEGRYSYTGDDGRLVSVEYTADETGFHPVTPPPPASVQRLLAHLQKVNGGVRY